MANMSEVFQQAAIQQIDQVLKHSQSYHHINIYNIGHPSPRPTTLWDEVRNLLELASKISNLTQSIGDSLELFNQILIRAVDRMWDCRAKPKHILFLLFDETLLALLKKLKNEQGGEGLYFWHARFAKQITYVHHFRCNVEPIVLRSMHYTQHHCIINTVSIVVAKIAGDRLPNELADLITTYALANYDISVPANGHDTAWDAVNVDAIETVEHPADCCSLLRHDFHNYQQPQSPSLRREVVFWSVSERRYIRFHEVSARALIDESLNRYSDILSKDGYRVQDGVWVTARCREQLPKSHKLTSVLVAGGPLAEGIDGFQLYESDHVVDRNWRYELPSQARDFDFSFDFDGPYESGFHVY